MDQASRDELFRTLTGGGELMDWFGFAPSFHDATLERLDLAGRDATLTIMAFRMTSEVDDKGYFVSDRHARVTVRLEGITHISLTGHDATAIIGELEIARLQDGYALRWDSSYGLDGEIRAREFSFAMEPSAVARQRL